MLNSFSEGSVFLEAAVLESNVIFFDSGRNALGKWSYVYCQFQLDEQGKKKKGYIDVQSFKKLVQDTCLYGIKGIYLM